MEQQNELLNEISWKIQSNQNNTNVRISNINNFKGNKTILEESKIPYFDFFYEKFSEDEVGMLRMVRLSEIMQHYEKIKKKK